MKFIYIILFVLLIICSYTLGAVFEFNGTVYAPNGSALVDAHINITLQNVTGVANRTNIGWVTLGVNTTTSGTSGWFELNVTNSTKGWQDNIMYTLTITHFNYTTGNVDFVSASLPPLPYSALFWATDAKYYLKDAGTIIITAVNSSRVVTNFSYQIKDQKLGYPVGNCLDDTSKNYTKCYLPRDRNYSIMVYPALFTNGSLHNSNETFAPVYFNWNNFTSTSSYNITDGLSDNTSQYNSTNLTLIKKFNITQYATRIRGYCNGTTVGVDSFAQFNVVPFILEPGNIVSPTKGILPWNVSGLNLSRATGTSDNLSGGDSTGLYNITLPYSPAETTDYLLYFTGQNGSYYYGGYLNLTTNSSMGAESIERNCTMYGLVGGRGIINMTNATNMSGGKFGNYLVNTSLVNFNLVNSSNNATTLANISATIKATVDYSSYGALRFSFVDQVLTSSNASNITGLPLLNVTGIDEIEVFPSDFAPISLGKITVARMNANDTNLSLYGLNFTDFNNTLTTSSAITIQIYNSNSTCNTPNPPLGCLRSTNSLATFNPMKIIIGGGIINLRVIYGNIVIYYINVDLLASPMPDINFQTSAIETTSGSSFKGFMKYLSKGPKLYDYVLVSLPYSVATNTGLRDDANISMNVSLFYNVEGSEIWNTALNGTSALNLYTYEPHYRESASSWAVLMNSTNCTTDVSSISQTNPCYIDASNDIAWIRLPQFSGVNPTLEGIVVTNPTTTSTTTTNAGGSSASTTTTTEATAISTEQLSQGYATQVTNGEALTFDISGSDHSITINNIGGNYITFTLASTPQEITMYTGEEKKFELTGDTYYDLRIKLNSIESSQADLEVQSIQELMPKTEIPQSEEVIEEEGVTGELTVEEGFEKIKNKAWILIIVAILIIIAVIYFLSRKRK